MSECTTTASRSSAVSSPGNPRRPPRSGSRGRSRWARRSSPPDRMNRVGGLAASQRAGAELVVLEHLGVAARDRVAGRAVRTEPDPADEVLTEVEQRLAGRARSRSAIGLISSCRVISGPTCSSRVARSNSTVRTVESIGVRRGGVGRRWSGRRTGCCAGCRTLGRSSSRRWRTVCVRTVRVGDHQLADEADLVAVVGVARLRSRDRRGTSRCRAAPRVHLRRLRRGEPAGDVEAAAPAGATRRPSSRD